MTTLGLLSLEKATKISYFSCVKFSRQSSHLLVHEVVVVVVVVIVDVVEITSYVSFKTIILYNLVD